ncbi:MAG: tRNA (adenosine(37)-N6)-threonylcarbamoyltransferase complex ATPase subunit type 1 TsaE [Frankiaceae bacterium]|nr:tRNA (adenosine(37)-N6)-threonylcarbamoyltransferase complex ATPase subunit type 1 TsaE [Frankiaceae bacterium]
MRVERVLGAAPVEEVQQLTVRAFAGQDVLTPPSGALSERAQTIAADFAESGGVLLRSNDGPLVGACRVRRLGLSWVVRRCAVDPAYRGQGLGRRLVEEVHAWAADEGAVRTHIGVRDALPASRAFWEQLGYWPLIGHGFWTELVRPLTLELRGAEATVALGGRLATELRAGDLLVLSGPLGAGKTALAQGIGAGLDVQGRVTSPTFVLARVHRGRLPLVHVDAYRLRDAGGRLELDDLDLDASLPDSVTVVEWGEGLVEGLTDSRLDVQLQRPSEDARTVTVTPVGARWSVFTSPPGDHRT